MAITFVAFAVRLMAIWQSGPSVIRFGDAPDYLAAAASLCSSGMYPEQSSMPFFRAPGLPFFIAGVTGCHTSSIWLVKLGLAAVGTLTVVILYFLAEDLFSDTRAALLAAAISAVYPFFVVQSTDVQTEGLFMFFLVTAVWLSARIDDVWLAAALTGLCAASAALIRPVGLLLLGLLPLRIFLSRRTGGVRQLAASLALFLAGAGLFLIPWIIRNEIRFHELILVNDAGGYNLWRGTSPELAAISDISDPSAFNEASVRFEKVVTPALAEKINAAGATPEGRSQEWYRLAELNFEREPAGFASRLLRNAWIFWRPWLNPATSSGTVVMISGALVLMLYLGALQGWRLLNNRDSTTGLWFAFYILVFWILQVPFQVVSRFRIPVIDPFLIALTAASLSALMRGCRVRYFSAATSASMPSISSGAM